MNTVLFGVRAYLAECRKHPIGAVLSALFFIGVLLMLLTGVVTLLTTPLREYLNFAIGLVVLAGSLFAFFSVFWLADRLKNERIRISFTVSGIFIFFTLGSWVFDGNVPLCGWEGVFGHITWCR